MRKWAAFWLISVIWGSSFLLIRIGVEEFSPFQVVFIRTGIAAIGLNLVLLARGKRLPFEWKKLFPLIVIGVGNTAVPFTLISWGEQSIDSGLASVLQSTAALFTLIIAHFVFADERINLRKVIGLSVGFIGVIVLASRSWASGEVIVAELTGALAIVGASLFYAMFTTYSRVQISNKFEPLVVAAGSMTAAAIVSGLAMVAAPFLGGEAAVSLDAVTQDVLFAVLLLGFLNTFVAYLMYYWVVQQLGAARASMVTYVVPAVGLALGVIVLNEPLDWRLLAGAGLIFAAIAIVNMRRVNRFRRVAPVDKLATSEQSI